MDHQWIRRTGAMWVIGLMMLLMSGSRQAAGGDQHVNLTFFVVSDTHYGLTERGDQTMPELVDLMNALPGEAYPEAIGGKVGRPRGVLHLGDITNDGKAQQWAKFVADYGLNGEGGRLKYPVYEAVGNHDGGPIAPVRDGIRQRNRSRAGLTSVSENGLHYAWDWDGVHLVNLNVCPGTTTRPYDPEHSLNFLAADLAENVGDSGRPVVLMHHFGFDDHSTGWWSNEWRQQYFDLIRNYRVIAILHGHAHKPMIYAWNGLDVYHPPHFRQKDPKHGGPVSHGIFVFHLTDDELTVAERRLDGTWGMTSRKPIIAAGPRAPPAVAKAAEVPRPATAATDKPQRDVTFISTSDTHYVEAARANDRNASNRQTVDQINAIASSNWPDQLGGGPVGKPRGVVVLGDCIDDGDRVINGQNISAEQYQYFSADFGVNGEGRVTWPVFEGWGNHDGPPVGAEKHGFSFQAQLKARNRERLEKGLITNLSDNGLHYSWDWDDVHLVQLNLYPADKQREGVRYSPVWHDPQGSLSFLKKDLAEKVGDSGRPVVLMSHCGFDTDWWTPEDWRELYDAVSKYNIVLYLYGHSGTGVRRWAPPGESKKWLCINDGQLEKGFFVIQIKGDRLRAAMRFKTGCRTEKTADGAIRSVWDGQWEWRHLAAEKIN